MVAKNLGRKHITSFLKLDGGAIEVHEDLGVVSDRVLEDNDADPITVLNEIKDKLGLSRLTVVPYHCDDPTGHVDGLVRYIDRNRVLINDLSGEMQIWRNEFESSLTEAGYELVVVPYFAHVNMEDWDARGIYLNFLKLDDLIIMPRFDHELDNQAKAVIQDAFPNHEVVSLLSNDIARKGGIINCVTWNEKYLETT